MYWRLEDVISNNATTKCHKTCNITQCYSLRGQSAAMLNSFSLLDIKMSD